jgi:hypothetical protein
MAARRSLSALDESLRAIGSRLVVRRGAVDEILDSLLTETGASALYFNLRRDGMGDDAATIARMRARDGRSVRCELSARSAACAHGERRLQGLHTVLEPVAPRPSPSCPRPSALLPPITNSDAVLSSRAQYLGPRRRCSGSTPG